MKNFFLFASMFGLFLLAFDSGLNKSTLNQCTNNNDNSACNYNVNATEEPAFVMFSLITIVEPSIERTFASAGIPDPVTS